VSIGRPHPGRHRFPGLYQIISGCSSSFKFCLETELNFKNFISKGGRKKKGGAVGNSSNLHGVAQQPLILDGAARFSLYWGVALLYP